MLVRHIDEALDRLDDEAAALPEGERLLFQSACLAGVTLLLLVLTLGDGRSQRELPHAAAGAQPTVPAVATTPAALVHQPPARVIAAPFIAVSPAGNTGYAFRRVGTFRSGRTR